MYGEECSIVLIPLIPISILTERHKKLEFLPKKQIVQTYTRNTWANIHTKQPY